MKKKKILVICPTSRDKKELSSPKIKEKYDIIFHSYDEHSVEKILYQEGGWLTHKFNPDEMINAMVAKCNREKVDAVISSEDYPGSIFASIIAQKCNLPGPHPQTVLLCQHKYHARQQQKKYVPHAVPFFDLVDNLKKDISFPLFTKPVKSFFSVLAHKVMSHDQLQQIAHKRFPAEFLQQFNWFLKHYAPFCHIDTNNLLAEGLLQGKQATLDGYVYKGNVHIFGVVDSIMFENGISFKHFEYPSILSENVQKRMACIAKKFMTGIGFDNGCFNIEFMYNTQIDGIFIIEVNPRLASQHADLYEKVDGTNTYEVLLALALGKRPKFYQKKGNHNVAGSFVYRFFEDQQVVKVPSAYNKKKFFSYFPDARLQIFAQEGKKLSDQIQDGHSFRYGLVHLGAQNFEQLYGYFEQSKKLLSFVFESV